MIESSQNSRVKLVRELVSGRKMRGEADVFVLETPKVIDEILRDFPERVRFVLRRDLDVRGDVFDGMVSLKGHQGMVAVVEKPVWRVDLTRVRRILVLDGVQDPGNLGGLYRSAVAFGVDAVLTMKGCVDIWHPLALRGAACGLSVPVLEWEVGMFDVLRENGVLFWGFDGEGGVDIRESGVPGRVGIVLGAEGRGLSEFWEERIDTRVRILVSEGVESLNVGVAGGIGLFYLLG